ncbi:aspartate dehydrogenase [Burkholderia stagnalis]
MNIGLIGLGSVGRFIVDQLNVKRLLSDVFVHAVCVDAKGCQRDESIPGARTFVDHDAFLDTETDLVVEAATVDVAAEMVPRVLARGRSVLLLSVGVLADPRFRRDAADLCVRFGARVYVPSGAIGGLDALRAANALGGVREVSLTTTKGLSSLEGGSGEARREVVFDGAAAQAIRRFPKNANVSIALSLCGIGADATEVCMVRDPAEVANRHSIDVSGEFGRFSVDLHCAPMPGNPRTSALAALSVIAALRNLRSPVMFV